MTRIVWEKKFGLWQEGKERKGISHSFAKGPHSENGSPCFAAIFVFPAPPPAASGLCFLDANCFCYLCQLPTLTRHFPADKPRSLGCFLCLFKLWKKRTSAPPPSARQQSSSRPRLSTVPWRHTSSPALRGSKINTRKQKWQLLLLIWNKIIQEISVLTKRSESTLYI